MTTPSPHGSKIKVSVERLSSVAGSVDLSVLTAIINLGNAIFFFAVAYGQVPNTHLLAWFSYSALIFLPVLFYVKNLKNKGSGQYSRKKSLKACAVAVAAASPWMLMLVLFVKAGPAALDGVQFQIAAGMAAGGALTLYRDRSAVASYLATILITASVVSCWRDPVGLWVTAVYCIPYGAALWLIASKTAKISEGRERVLQEKTDALLHLKRANSEILRLVQEDSLTGFPNRKAFSDRLESTISQASKNKTPFAVLLLDLDRFKDINDSYGHEAGDLLLVSVASSLSLIFQEKGFVARLGGDEFAVILESVASAEDVQKAAQMIVDGLTQPMRIKKDLLYTGASVGSAIFPEHAQSPQDLLRHADMALADAKLAGRGRAVMFHTAMSQLVERREVIERDLRSALNLSELELWYQPQFNIVSGRLEGAEALLRWRKSDGTQISPTTFLTVAEDRGLVGPISDFVFGQATADMAEWLSRDLEPPRLSLNVHAIDLKSSQAFLDRLEKLYDGGVRPEMITLEITEGCVIGRGAEHSVDLLREIAARGFMLSLDDFGTGHASLVHLRRLPVGEIKIDKSFIDGLLDNVEDQTIVRAAIEVCRSLNIKCVAEGVETETQRQALRELAGDDVVLLGQGWLWSKALPSDAFAQLLKNSAQRLSA